jgi:hypothetical protein
MAHFSWVMTIEVPAYFHVPIIIGQLVPGGGAGGQLPHPVFTPIICWWDGSAVCEPTRIPAIFTTYWARVRGGGNVRQHGVHGHGGGAGGELHAPQVS